MADECELAVEEHTRLHDLYLRNRMLQRERQCAKAGASNCDECGAEISKERRQAAPESTKCVDCASIEEGRERRFRR
jgi:RNA polymerase-binding transcription factor DksA